jgi:hypothetical protein
MTFINRFSRARPLACRRYSPVKNRGVTVRLLAPTAEGRARIARLSGRQTEWADLVNAGLDPSLLAAARDMLKTLIERVESTEVPP